MRDYPDTANHFPLSAGALAEIRWGWILAVALGCLLGLLLATWLGETGARLGAPDAFDLMGLSLSLPPLPAAH